MMSYLGVEPAASTELWSLGGEISSIDLADNSPQNDPAAGAVRVELSQRRLEMYSQRTAAAVKIQRWFRHVKAQPRLTLSSSTTSMSEDEETEGDLEGTDIYTPEPNHSITSPSIQHQSSFDKYVEEQYLITLVMVNEKSISSLTEDQQEAVRKLRAEIKGPPPEEIQPFQEVRCRRGYNKPEKQDIVPVGGSSAKGCGKKCANPNTIRPDNTDPKTVLRKQDLLEVHPRGFKPTLNNAYGAKQMTDCTVERHDNRTSKAPQFGKRTDLHTENQQLFRTKRLAHEHHQAPVQEDMLTKTLHCSNVNNGENVAVPTQRRMDKHRSRYGKLQGVSTGNGLNTAGNRLHTKNANGLDSSTARPTYDKVTLQPCTFKKKSKLTAHSKLHNQRTQNIVAGQETSSTVRELNRLEKIPGKLARRLQGPSQLSFSSHKPSHLHQTETRGFIPVELEHRNDTSRKHYPQAWDEQRMFLDSLSPPYYEQDAVEMLAVDKNSTSLQTGAGYLQQLSEPRRSTIRALQTPVYRPPPQKPAGSYLLRHLKGGARAGPAKHKRKRISDLVNYSTLSTPGLGYSYCPTHWRTQAPASGSHMHEGMLTHLQSSTDLELFHASVPSKRNPLRAAAHPHLQRSLPAYSWPSRPHGRAQHQKNFNHDGLSQTGCVIYALPGVSMSNGTGVTPLQYLIWQ